MRNKPVYIKAALLLILLSNISFVSAQYFGRNKVQYERFPFTILETEHFQVFNYLNDTFNINSIGRTSEDWYQKHMRIFNDTFETKNPIIIYNNHAEFQQTTVIESMLGTGTNGVTEAFKTRVVIPYLESGKETSHVLGHEMVHVFQYNIVKFDDSLMLSSIMNVPLWMVEGLAEYLSIGGEDSHTALWMRDAVMNNDIPSFDDLTRDMGEYFPYRYGHAVWAFIVSKYGADKIKPLFRNCAMYGYEPAIKLTLGIKSDSLSNDWKRAMKRKYLPLYDSIISKPNGEVLFNKENSGEMNFSPNLSPDGKFMAFQSDRDVLSLDIYLADPLTKKVIRKLSTSVQKPYIDEYNYLGSAGTWSPDSRYYAISGFVKGRNKLLIIDVVKSKIYKRIDIPGVKAFINPSWSPDSKRIALSGMADGIVDLFLYNIDADTVTNLTNDYYSDMMPRWSPDGKILVFISDRGPDTDLKNRVYGNYRLCTIDIETNKVHILNVLPKANNVDPMFTPDGSSILFLSDADGYRNLYEYKIQSNLLYKLTNYFTGITGITELSPAISVAADGELVYTLYRNKNYDLYKARLSDFTREPVDLFLNEKSAAILPVSDSLIDTLKIYHLQDTINIYDTSQYEMIVKTYHPKFSVEYIGSSGVGGGMSRFGAAFYGGVNLWFSDMLKQQQLFTALQVNGEVQDIGGAIYYLNKVHRINWGGGISHIPYRYSYFGYAADSIDGQVAENLVILDYRTYVDQVSMFGYFPMSKKNRFESGLGFTRYSFRIDSINNYYVDGYRYDKNEKKIDAPEGYNVYESYIAYVSDNSYFGFTSPMSGYRYRIELNKYFGDRNLYGVLLDGRKYFFMRPLSFAFRFLHYGRYGGDANLIYPFFIGSDYYGFLRGYTGNSFYKVNRIDGSGLSINSLVGSKIMVSNAEVRFPFSGHERLSLIHSKFFYTDLVLFFDAGLAWENDLPWNSVSDVLISWEPKTDKRIPVYSSGVSLRFNLFGMLILEPYYAFPFQQFLGHGVWGLTFSAGGW